MKQFRRAESEKNCRQKIRGRANQLITNSGDDRANGPDKILRGMIRWRIAAKPHPGRHVLWRVRDQREKKQRADEK